MKYESLDDKSLKKILVKDFYEEKAVDALQIHFNTSEIEVKKPKSLLF